MKTDISNVSNEVGHIAVYRSIFGYYIVDFHRRIHRLTGIRQYPTKRMRFLTRRKALLTFYELEKAMIGEECRPPNNRLR